VPLPALAQTTGSISGVVEDPTGQPLAGVVVSAQSLALQRDGVSATTGANGTYRLAPIPAGVYEVSFSREGFGTQTLEGVRVGVNAEITLDWTLGLETVEETVQVTSEVPLMELTRSELANRVPTEAIDNLPLQTRNAEDLVTLLPGVTPRPEAARGQQFSVFGERPSATAFIYDGADNSDPIDGGSFLPYPQDSVQEFEVITAGYRAELGRAQGGVVNVITRSGTNDTQARAFYFVRDDSWDSSNIPDQPPPELTRDQYGLSVGGDVVEDRTFYFVAAEALDEQRGRNVDLSTVPDWVQAGLATVQGSEDFSLGPAVDGLTAIGKIDLLPNERQRWAFALNLTENDATGELPPATVAGSLLLPSGTRASEVDNLAVTLTQTTVFGPQAFLDSSVRYLDGDIVQNSDKEGRAEVVLLLFRSGFIQTSSSSPANGARSERQLDRLAVNQSFSLFHDRHEMKLGYEVLDTGLDGFDTVSNDVEYSAAFLAPDFVDVNEDLFRRFGFEQSAARFLFLSPNPDGSLPVDISNTDVGLFAQDSIQVGDNLRVDVGLRYDRASLFGDDDDNFAPRLGFAWDVGGRHRTLVKGSAGLFYDQNALVAAATVPDKGGIFRISAFDVVLPRLGFTYPGSLIDIVITSGGFGPPENPLYQQFAAELAANPLLLYELFGIAVADPTTPPLVTADNIEALSGMTPDEAVALLESRYPGTDWIFFDMPGGSIVGDRVLSFLPRGALDAGRTIPAYARDRVPYTEAYTLGVEHQFGNDVQVGLTLVKRESDDILTQRIVNLVDARPGQPGFGQSTDGGPFVNAFTYEGVIDYEGVTASVNRPFRGRWGLMFSYTFSDNQDNLLTGNPGSTFSDNNDASLDYGDSNLSVPNVAVLSATVQLPLDIRLSGIAYHRDGPAFSPRGISDTDGDGLVDQRDLSIPRNSVRVDDVFNVDLRLEKPFRLGNGHEITLLAEAFNLTNEANVSGVNTVSGNDFGTPNDFLPGREIQLGVRYFFGR
jgi:outer membrane receptor protein involved in Fe transport